MIIEDAKKSVEMAGWVPVQDFLHTSITETGRLLIMQKSEKETLTTRKSLGGAREDMPKGEYQLLLFLSLPKVSLLFSRTHKKDQLKIDGDKMLMEENLWVYAET